MLTQHGATPIVLHFLLFALVVVVVLELPFVLYITRAQLL
jgi:hypothetical protein